MDEVSTEDLDVRNSIVSFSFHWPYIFGHSKDLGGKL